MGMKIDSGMFAGQTQLENGQKMLESFNKIYCFLDFFLIDIHLDLMQRKLAFVCLLLVSHHVN